MYAFVWQTREMKWEKAQMTFYSLSTFIVRSFKSSSFQYRFHIKDFFSIKVSKSLSNEADNNQPKNDAKLLISYTHRFIISSASLSHFEVLITRDILPIMATTCLMSRESIFFSILTHSLNSVRCSQALDYDLQFTMLNWNKRQSSLLSITSTHIQPLLLSLSNSAQTQIVWRINLSFCRMHRIVVSQPKLLSQSCRCDSMQTPHLHWITIKWTYKGVSEWLSERLRYFLWLFLITFLCTFIIFPRHDVICIIINQHILLDMNWWNAMSCRDSNSYLCNRHTNKVSSSSSLFTLVNNCEICHFIWINILIESSHTHYIVSFDWVRKARAGREI